MKKFVLIPDSFKGTLSSTKVCDILESCILRKDPNASVVKIPVADGGEGSVDAFIQAVGGEIINLQVSGPYFDKVESFYGLIDHGQCAVIEMAACAGLPLVEDRKNPMKTTTYGVGELIKDALDKGVKKIIIGLGGSCTNDGGTGCAAALGVTFINHQGEKFVPVGGTLHDIADIDMSNLDSRLKTVELITMCDIENPLYGPTGAAYVYGPQKGADPAMVTILDHNLKSLACVVENKLGFHDWDFKGAGAAGGMGYGMRVFLNSKIQMGIETVLDITGFDNMIKDADYIITGEGKIDYQSLRGKVVNGVARRAQRQSKKVIAIVGMIGEGAEGAYAEGVSEIIETNYRHLPFEEVKKRAEIDLEEIATKLIDQIYDFQGQ